MQIRVPRGKANKKKMQWIKCYHCQKAIHIHLKKSLRTCSSECQKAFREGAAARVAAFLAKDPEALSHQMPAGGPKKKTFYPVNPINFGKV